MGLYKLISDAVICLVTHIYTNWLCLMTNTFRSYYLSRADWKNNNDFLVGWLEFNTTCTHARMRGRTHTHTHCRCLIWGLLCAVVEPVVSKVCWVDFCCSAAGSIVLLLLLLPRSSLCALPLSQFVFCWNCSDMYSTCIHCFVVEQLQMIFP